MRSSFHTGIGLAVLMLLASAAVGQVIRYVDANANGLNNGESWANAYTEFYLGLSDTNATEIWVADGTYYPRPVEPGNDPRIATFMISGGSIRILGGFLGVSTEDPDGEDDPTLRNPEQNLTILSGDLGHANPSTRDPVDENGLPLDFPTDSAYLENAYHVVAFQPSFLGTPIYFSGFVIRGGYANGVVIEQDQGGGILMSMNNPPDVQRISAPILSRNRIEYNFATVRGGGMAVSSKAAFATLANCRFEHNYNEGSASNGGGGALSTSQTGLYLQNCQFFNNHTEFGTGGAIVMLHSIDPNSDGLNVTNCSFHANTAYTPIDGAGAIAEVRLNLCKTNTCDVVHAPRQHALMGVNNQSPKRERAGPECTPWQ